MPVSFSAMRKKLEQENLCDCLKGHIRYFMTRYHDAHDDAGRAAILFDGEEIFKTSYFAHYPDYYSRFYELRKTVPEEELMDALWNKVIADGCFDLYQFYDAFHIYDNQSIAESLVSENALVRLFAYWDKRTGKRRLVQLQKKMETEPEWLRMLLGLRLELEGVIPADDNAAMSHLPKNIISN